MHVSLKMLSPDLVGGGAKHRFLKKVARRSCTIHVLFCLETGVLRWAFLHFFTKPVAYVLSIWVHILSP